MGKKDKKAETLRDSEGTIHEEAEEDSVEIKPHTQTCEQVKIILMKTEVTIEQGLRIVCLHHRFLMLPVMELSLGSFSMRYDILFDHSIISGSFL